MPTLEELTERMKKGSTLVINRLDTTTNSLFEKSRAGILEDGVRRGERVFLFYERSHFVATTGSYRGKGRTPQEACKEVAYLKARDLEMYPPFQ